MDFYALKDDINEEVSTILASDFTIHVTETRSVPHASDAAITFPNLDQKTQGTKLIETTVLYVDMRRSTQLSLQHRRYTVAKLYSAFVRAMTRCASAFGGEVRGIIGDRVMVLFEPTNCFTSAVDAAVLMNSVCANVINKHFALDAVRFGIGIDYGHMLATKTGIRRHGAAQQSYRSLVWLGRPANVASKLTDAANKPEEAFDCVMVNVGYDYGFGLIYQEEAPHLFVQNFSRNALTGQMYHTNPAFRSFHHVTRRLVTRVATPPILMTERVHDGFRAARPEDVKLQKSWIKPVALKLPDYKDKLYGMDVIYTVFQG